MPVWKRFTAAAPGALNVWAFATDDITLLTFIRSRANRILDIIADPALAAGVEHIIEICRAGTPTGKRLSSPSLNPASAGRAAVGPIKLNGGDYNFNVAQRLGALSAFSFLVKFERDP